MENGIGMQLTSISNNHIVIDHNPRMEDAIDPDPTACTNADPSCNETALPNDCTGIHHSCGMDPGERSLSGVQLIERFGEREARIGKDRKGKPPLRGHPDQILLIRQKQCPNVTVGESRDQRVALLQKTQLIS